MRAWHKPQGTGWLTSPVQTRLELKRQWRDDGGQYSVAEFEQIRRGYLVNARRLDVALGRILDALKALRLWEHTIVCFHADHGLSLGEYGVAGKGKLLDVDVRVPFVIRAPSMPLVPPESVRLIDQVVELVDVYPTLCDLAGIPCPRRRGEDSSADTGRANWRVGAWQPGVLVAEGAHASGHAKNRSVASNGENGVGESEAAGGGGGDGRGDGAGKSRGSLMGQRHSHSLFEVHPPLDGRSLVSSLLNSLQRHPSATREASPEGTNQSPFGRGHNVADAADAVDAASAMVHAASAMVHAISVYPRCTPGPPSFSLSCNGESATSISVMGTSVVSMHRSSQSTPIPPLSRHRQVLKASLLMGRP